MSLTVFDLSTSAPLAVKQLLPMMRQIPDITARVWRIDKTTSCYLHALLMLPAAPTKDGRFCCSQDHTWCREKKELTKARKGSTMMILAFGKVEMNQGKRRDTTVEKLQRENKMISCQRLLK
jgi:hypothetical protein